MDTLGNVIRFDICRAKRDLNKLAHVVCVEQRSMLCEMLDADSVQVDYAKEKIAGITQLLQQIPVGEETGVIRDDALCYLRFQKDGVSYLVTEKHHNAEYGELVLCMRVVEGGTNIDFVHSPLDGFARKEVGAHIDLCWEPATIAETKRMLHAIK